MLKLQGIFLPVATPFNYQGEIYKVKVRHNVEKWNMVKLSGYVVCGSTGEGVHLSSEEKINVWGMVAEAKAEGRLLLAATGCEGVRETVALTNQAADLGYQAAVIRTPSYFRPLVAEAETQELYFRAVADQAKIPVILYNSPQSTGVDLAVESIARLSEHPNLIGIQENSGDVDKIGRIVRDAKKGFQVLAGSAASFWPSLDNGAVGGVLAFGNAAPYAGITIWEAYRTREREAAQDWQTRITLPAQLIASKYGIAGLKHAMDLNGYYGGPCRLPLCPLTPAGKAEIALAFDGIRG